MAKSTIVPLLSIIVPVYNAEKYLLDCLDSVLSQLVPSVELIIVDDGSTDGSALIISARVLQLAELGQVKFFRQSNAGPGAARNLGLRMARGRYVGFLDSDDLLAPTYVGEILGVISAHEVDIVEFPFQRFKNNDDVSLRPYDAMYGAVGMNRLDALRVRIFASARWFPCTRVFRRDIFDSIRFPEGVHYEDLMTIPLIYLQPLMIYFLEAPLYAYRENPESITARHTHGQFDDLVRFFNGIEPNGSTALAILKIRTGRMIVYFGSEFSCRFSKLIKVANAATAVELTSRDAKLLGMGDRLFYWWPRLYVLVERLRVLLKHWR
jgi:glycosyltransferase involved in cell wall biosynthesis